MPLTNGAASDVPLPNAYPVGPADRRSDDQVSPGAASATQSPQLLKPVSEP